MPALDFRAVMLDPARLMENKERYTELLPHLAAWGYNVLHLHITDDEGCRMVFARRPELASAGAFTVEEMKALIARARDVGIEVIPEIESLGHTRYITEHAGYRDLAEPVGPGGFNAICPAHPDTRPLLDDLLTDAAEVFDSTMIHVGLDEVRFGECPRCGSRRSEDRFVDHASWVLDKLRALGKRPAMWGDHMLKSERIADAIGRDVLVFDWHYEARIDPGTIEYFLGRGFEVVEAPAAVAYGSARLAPTREAAENLRHSTMHARRYSGRGLRGACVTSWAPYRHLPGVADPMIAFGGHLLSAGGEQSGFWRSFVSSHYGLDDEEAARALAEFHDALPRPRDIDSVLWPDAVTAETELEHRRISAELRARMQPIRRTLAEAARRATKHAEDLANIALTAGLALAVADFGEGRRPAASNELLASVESAWARTRSPSTLRMHDHRALSDRASDCLLCILQRLRKA